MLAAWIESLGGVPAATTLATAVSAAAVRCYGLRIRERMHKERLQVDRSLPRPGPPLSIRAASRAASENPW